MRSITFVLALFIVVSGCGNGTSGNSTPTAAEAKKFMDDVNETEFKLALEAGEAHMLAVRDARELLRCVPGPGDAHPRRGLGPEALRRRQGDVLRRALGLRQQAVPKRARRALEVLYVLGPGDYGV